MYSKKKFINLATHMVGKTTPFYVYVSPTGFGKVVTIREDFKDSYESRIVVKLKAIIDTRINAYRFFCDWIKDNFKVFDLSCFYVIIDRLGDRRYLLVWDEKINQ